MKTILLTGATGLVGQALVPLLQEHYHVRLLSRRPKSGFETWNPQAKQLDPNFLQDVYAVIHLAGAPIAQHRWTKPVKERLWASRVHTTTILVDAMQYHRPEVFICASAIGLYGVQSGICTEETPPAGGFLSELVQAWEAAASPSKSLDVRHVSLRFGNIFSTKGGMLPPLLWSHKYNLGMIVGSGTQCMSWIYIDDAVSVILRALADERYTGALNLTTPNPVSFATLQHELAKHMGKRLWLPRVPAGWVR